MCYLVRSCISVQHIPERGHLFIATLTKSHLAVNACLAPVASMHGLAVTTVEGIGSTKTQLHPVQKRIAEAHGSQCGFCTPGIVMSMYTLLRNLHKPTMKDMEIAFQGNFNLILPKPWCNYLPVKIKKSLLFII